MINTNNLLIDSCLFQLASGSVSGALLASSSNTTITGVTFQNNIIYGAGNGTYGVNVIATAGFELPSTITVGIYNNTIHHVGTAGIVFTENDAPLGTATANGTVKNNIVTNSGTQDYYEITHCG